MAGTWHSELHEEAVYQAFIKLGHEVVRFAWFRYFLNSWRGLPGLIALPFVKAQNKYMLGPIFNRLNRDLVELAKSERPDIIFVYRGTHVTASSLRAIREALPDVVMVGYNNDDPFSGHYPGWLWRHFMAAVPEYDLMLAYRHRNLEDFRRAGARRVELLRSWFMPDRNFPASLSDSDMQLYGCDVAFIGHYEHDGRLEMLEEIARRGINLKLYGPGYEWDERVARSPLLKDQAPVHLVWGEAYNKAICGAKIALCFFSRLNRDTYTRRCFEIPATGTMLLSEYSEDMSTLFDADKEAVFFSDKDELLSKIEQYIADDTLRASVARAGLQRVIQDGHDVVSRMRQVMHQVVEIQHRGCHE